MIGIYSLDGIRVYAIHKLIRNSAAGIFLMTMLGIWVQRLQSLLLLLGTTGAGLAIALAPVIVSMAGWALIISSKLYKVGDRVQLGGVIGDVTDVGIIRTSLLEIGNWVQADQLTAGWSPYPTPLSLKLPCSITRRGPHISGMSLLCRSPTDPAGNQRNRLLLKPWPTIRARIADPATTALRQLPGMSLVGSPETQAQPIFPSRNIGWPARCATWSMPNRGVA